MTSSVRGIGELIAYLPYNLGFVPHGSLVVIGLCDGCFCATARIDRPPVADAAGAAEQVGTTLARSDPDEVVVICYDGFGAADRLFVLELADLLHGRAIALSHVTVVRSDGTWRAEQCSCGGCPREWVPVPAATDVAPVAEQVVRGVAPAEKRADLARRFELQHPPIACAVEAQIVGVDPRQIDTAAVLPPVLLDHPTPVHSLPVGVLASATLAVQSVSVRDEVLSWLMPGFLPAGFLEEDAPIDPHHLGLPPVWLREVDAFDDPVELVAHRLEDWVGCIPRARSVPVLLLSAAIRWFTGGGVLASMAVDRALAIDPHCKLALLFAAALHSGLRPSDGEQRPA